MESKTVEERIVMTPIKKGHGHTRIKIERVQQTDENNSSVMHVAGGAHKGIVINKEASSGEDDQFHAQLTLEFKVFLTNAANDTHTQESRQLKFWFKNEVSEPDQMRNAQDFFKELVSPSHFPKDYVGFIKGIMKLMQLKYRNIRKIEVEIRQIEEITEPPTRPISMDENSIGAKVGVNQEKVLEMIESAYPNPLTVTDMAKTLQCTEEEVHLHLDELKSKGIIKLLENGSYTRVTQNDTEVKMVRQVPTVISSQQPSIAIITAQYCEKVAVDAMIENKDTYVRYKTEGESNVYTLGNIGAHRVVATKLPAVGHHRGAMIAAGNTTTRLLGSFQKVEYVFLVGIGGGVPHYTDYSKHVRLGDVVVSTPPEGQNDKFIYIYCEKTKNSSEDKATNGTLSSKHNIKRWCPPSLCLQEIAQQLWAQGLVDAKQRPWEDYIRHATETLASQEADFNRPSPETDKLFMSIGGKDIIEVGHPQAPEGTVDYRQPGKSMIHFGGVASGRALMKDDAVRQEFANQRGILAFDSEFDAVVESIYGNRKDNYVFIRGISDYKDGTKNKEWQPYSALAAAAFMKALICALDPCDDQD
ncbi:uncharacterized protein LOC106458690 isoform X3 [Limulus polyphemus]|uniref:Uncharacterized protein LOC106458690 isoform X3 n=1 Tax=Limulus polyphemus TaxID=6850 RepID=A0ABM1B2W4_LIMPO|nr:uncharacterized protein LOC106458690 isoform X3 [Limulus polyphemus]